MSNTSLHPVQLRLISIEQLFKLANHIEISLIVTLSNVICLICVDLKADVTSMVIIFSATHVFRQKQPLSSFPEDSPSNEMAVNLEFGSNQLTIFPLAPRSQHARQRLHIVLNQSIDFEM